MSRFGRILQKTSFRTSGIEESNSFNNNLTKKNSISIMLFILNFKDKRFSYLPLAWNDDESFYTAQLKWLLLALSRQCMTLCVLWNGLWMLSGLTADWSFAEGAMTLLLALSPSPSLALVSLSPEDPITALGSPALRLKYQSVLCALWARKIQSEELFRELLTLNNYYNITVNFKISKKCIY